MATVSASIGATNAFVAIQTDSPGIGSVLASFQGTTAATFVFEATNDSVNWFAVFALPMNTATTLSGGAPVSSYAPTTTTGVAYIIPVYGYTQVRVRASSYTSGLASVALDSAGTSIPWLGPQGYMAMPILLEGQKAGYRAASGAIAPVAACTDLASIIGSATKTVRITQIGVSVFATAAGEVDILINKHNAADTGSTPSAVTPSLLDNNNAAVTAAVQTFTSTNPTIPGPSKGVAWSTVGVAANTNAQVVFDFGTRNNQALVLRGVAQEVAINLNGATLLTGQKMSYWFEWTEE